MRICIIFMLLLRAGFAAGAQTLHTPAEILTILEGSSKMYRFDLYDPDTVAPVDEVPLIAAEIFGRQREGEWILSSYAELLRGRPAVAEIRKRAENYFADDRLEEARAEYLRVLDSIPGQSRVMTYIGQTYASEEESDKAISWYRRAIDLNELDYMAHWFLAERLSGRGEHDEAVDEIVKAHLLNRNNPRVIASLKRILANAGLRYMDWEFEPLYRVYALDTHSIMVAVAKEAPQWMSYAVAKAVWNHEPGYREKMEREHGAGTLIVEEKECILGLLLAMETIGSPKGEEMRRRMESEPGFRMLKSAEEKGLLDEFILYELASRTNPLLMYGITGEFFESTTEYVRKYRIEAADAH